MSLKLLVKSIQNSNFERFSVLFNLEVLHSVSMDTHCSILSLEWCRARFLHRNIEKHTPFDVILTEKRQNRLQIEEKWLQK